MATILREHPAPATSAQPPKSNLKIDYRQIRGSAASLLRQGLGKYALLLNSKLIDEVQSRFEDWLEDERREITSQLKTIPENAKSKWLEERFEIDDRRHLENRPLRLLIDFLFQFVQGQIKRLEALKSGNLKFRRAFARVRDRAEQEKLILNYASELGASQRQLRNDAEAFSRWFDEETVIDRYAKRVGQVELLLVFVFGRLAEVIGQVFSLAYKYHFESAGEDRQANQQALHQRLAGIWKRLNMEARINDALVCDCDQRVHIAVLKCLAAILGKLPDDLGAELLDHRALALLHRLAMDVQSDVWMQCESLSILSTLSFNQGLPFLRHRLSHPGAGDDMFVRRHALKLVENRLLNCRKRGGDRCIEVPPRESEPSPFVRQKLARVAFLSTHPQAQMQWKSMALEDPVTQVRAAALLAGIQSRTDSQMAMSYLDVVQLCLKNETDPFVLRTALYCLTRLLARTSEDKAKQHGKKRGSPIVARNGPRIPAPPVTNTVRRRLRHNERPESQVALITFYGRRILPMLTKLQSTHPEITVRRWSAQAHEQIWAQMDEQAHALIEKLRPIVRQIPPGRSRPVPGRMFRGIAKEKLGRILAVLSQNDFGYDLHRGFLGWRIVRGPSFGFRLWRFIHEFRNTATDKRQALRHTVGRINHATLRAPSQILGELSETKVPGEPLTIDSDGTWRPFLPLPDDFVSVLNLSWFFPRTVKFYTSQGVTTVTGPRKIVQQIRAAWKLSFGFAQFADKRNWDQDSYPPGAYIQSMRGLGFSIEFSNYAGDCESSDVESGAKPSRSGDDSVWRFFPSAVVGLPVFATSFEPAIWTYWQRFADYFTSAFENSLEQLVVFAGGILMFAIGKHLYANVTFRQARRRIPLSIGGWGTRGKSGTERLKSALIGVLGHGLVSKTTGCEAMFIHANPHGEPMEIPLFRPYDKATIWEQRNLLRMASRMDPSVFLWECMALTPSYVDILQRQWTCDDLGTITNTYPDHEDIQGPAGHNVAQTISGFVPLESRLLSTEQVMRPYIAESCRRAKTSFRGVGWLESGLITDDILERFPYKEHPDNIALIAAMGEELDCEFEYCLKAMADYLVPDLGVLKTHPAANVRTRKIEFSNGMSANERFGCMGNWRRLGFDDQDPWKDPGTWICGVVNNRADRVPRSKVFARIIVDDLRADRFFLIGSNLQGLCGFIDEAWERKAEDISLRDNTLQWNVDFALKTLKRAAWDFRQPIDPSHVQARLRHSVASLTETLELRASPDLEEITSFWNQPEQVRAMLRSVGIAKGFTDSIFMHQTGWVTAIGEYENMKLRITESSTSEADKLDQEFVRLLKNWHDRKLVVIEDYDATGEEVVATIIDQTPPGFLNRAMGLQNIKGTGLDFVYRFQAWDMCHEACSAALSNQVQMAHKGLQSLVSMPAIGQLCESRIREVLQHARSNSLYRRPELQLLLEQIEHKLREATGDDELENNSGTAAKSNGSARSALNRWIIETAEQFLDVHDSIRRRKTADLIYNDLANERISRQRAVVELRKLNKRQKGGWLAAEFLK